MDREVKQLKQSRIPIVKVRWNSRRGPEFIWEREDFFKSKYSHLFSNKKKASMKNRAPGRRSSKGRRIQEKKEGKDFDLFVGFHCIIMAPKKAPALTEANINRLIQERIDEAIAVERERVRNENNFEVPSLAPTPAPATDPAANPAPGSAARTATRECTFAGFLKCNPTSFHGNKGAVGLSRWIEKSKSVFDISKCAEGNKVIFAAATLQDSALTWWNNQVTSMGRAVANSKSWKEMKAMMKEEFCPPEEIQRMEHELWNLKVKDYNITAYTTRFNELILLCPKMVPTKKKKVEASI
ncbi:putative reverse transcriptase domain-containing protein [Tanacetum coccineum]